jgi:hypothetical protein
MFKGPAVGFVIGIIPALIALLVMWMTGQDGISTAIASVQVWVSVGCSGLVGAYLSQRIHCRPQA